MMKAGQLLDAICQATEVPEKYEGMPLGTRSIHVPYSEVAPDFIGTISRPARASQCERDIETDSDGDMTMAGALQMMNAPGIQEKLGSAKNRLSRLVTAKATDEDMVNELYLAMLSRPPKETDKKTVLEYVRRSTDRRKVWEDVQWSLLNSREFIMR